MRERQVEPAAFLVAAIADPPSAAAMTMIRAGPSSPKVVDPRYPAGLPISASR